MSACIEWSGSRNAKGYGKAGKRLAHRVEWERVHGPIPGGLFVLHRCDNPPCVNVDHLFLGDNSLNQRDSVAKGRHASTKKVTCPKRHPYDDTNTLSWGGVRNCRACRAEYMRDYYQRHLKAARLTG